MSVPSPALWAFGGGKGGVGKSLVCASVAVELARRGRRVVVVDADLGAANLHTLLGLLHPSRTLGDFFADPTAGLEACCVDTGIEGLRLVSGAAAILRAAHPRPVDKRHLADAVLALDADAVLLDLGAGTHYNTLDFFNLAGHRVVVTSAEPTSIQNAYAFIKAALFRRLELGLADHPWIIDPLARAVQPRGAERIESVDELIAAFETRDPAVAAQARRLIDELAPRLVINMAEPAARRRVEGALAVVCRRYLGLHPQHAATLPDDPAARQAVRRMRPVLLEAPDGPLARAVAGLVDAIDHLPSHPRPDLLRTADPIPPRVEAARSTREDARPAAEARHALHGRPLARGQVSPPRHPEDTLPTLAPYPGIHLSPPVAPIQPPPTEEPRPMPRPLTDAGVSIQRSDKRPANPPPRDDAPSRPPHAASAPPEDLSPFARRGFDSAEFEALESIGALETAEPAMIDPPLARLDPENDSLVEVDPQPLPRSAAFEPAPPRVPARATRARSAPLVEVEPFEVIGELGEPGEPGDLGEITTVGGPEEPDRDATPAIGREDPDDAASIDAETPVDRRAPDAHRATAAVHDIFDEAAEDAILAELDVLDDLADLDALGEGFDGLADEMEGISDESPPLVFAETAPPSVGALPGDFDAAASDAAALAAPGAVRGGDADLNDPPDRPERDDLDSRSGRDDREQPARADSAAVWQTPPPWQEPAGAPQVAAPWDDSFDWDAPIAASTTAREADEHPPAARAADALRPQTAWDAPFDWESPIDAAHDPAPFAAPDLPPANIREALGRAGVRGVDAKAAGARWHSGQLPGLSRDMLDAMTASAEPAVAPAAPRPERRWLDEPWDADPWEETALAAPIAASTGRAPEAMRESPLNPSRPTRRAGEPLPDPPGHPVIALEEAVSTADGALHLQTADLAPRAAVVRRAIYRDGRLIAWHDADYEPLIGEGGVAREPAQVPARVESLHEAARRALIERGLSGLDWPSRLREGR